MKTLVMITGVLAKDYLTGYFKENEDKLTPQERAAAMVKGFDILGVEGGSDTIYHYRISASQAPTDLAKWAFRAAEIDCIGASGRTWGNGQKGPMDADVTFTAIEVKAVELAVIQKEAERRNEQAKLDSDAYKAQRRALDALEVAVKARLAQATADAKPGK
ncbi:MAG: hypothetical protein H0U76_19440 [Ktedonobacteraceae bacterium]|nr:hypothetical protein [Ktedonobacteraceae bacterium]